LTRQFAAVTLKVQVPSPLQASAVQPSPSSHAYAVPPHAPAVQTSVFVQRFPSLHGVPFGLAGFEHRPLAGLHTPVKWHWSSGAQDIGVPARQ
jgi:hypothetical protein